MIGWSSSYSDCTVYLQVDIGIAFLLIGTRNRITVVAILTYLFFYTLLDNAILIFSLPFYITDSTYIKSYLFFSLALFRTSKASGKEKKYENDFLMFGYTMENIKENQI